MIDCGICIDEVKLLWRLLLAEQMASRPLARILVTHFHPDHLGLAGWLQSNTGAPLWMTSAEWRKATTLYRDIEGKHSNRQVALFRRNGLDEARLSAAAKVGNSYRKFISPPPADFQRIADDDAIAIGAHEWQVIVGAGHAPEHACLYCHDLGVLIAGDQVLPKITPNISLSAEEADADPLKMYLDSLDRFTKLPEDTLVLPSHGTPFYGLKLRLRQILEHHHERVDTLYDACVQPRTAAEMVSVMFERELDHHQIMFAMGESLSHLAYLKHRNRLDRGICGDGMVRYWQ